MCSGVTEDLSQKIVDAKPRFCEEPYEILEDFEYPDQKR
jgi:hypothetical protein